MSRSSSVETIFFAALEKADPEARAAYLESACSGDVELRRVVAKMLDAHPKAGGFLESPAEAVAVGEIEPRGELPGAVIGPYTLLEQIGEGGMGTVFMAEQTHPVQRRVALKVIKPGMDSRHVVARFENERQALALMDHVNIARVLDAGTTGAGSSQVPYFVMELVLGVPITEYCDDNHLTPRDRLELFMPVCRAIQHAHQKGIIHRDIKPSNVLVTLCDGKPVPKVIDFGVAKATEQESSERTLFTQHGTLVGTLEYMSPEQAESSAQGIDTRSDIYSLGVLLYELLTGSTPLDNERVRRAANAEVLRMIKEEDPPKPSTRLSDSGEALASISRQRRTDPTKLANLVRGDLDWIVMKTLEKDRNRRYETASGLAQDLQRYLADEPVLACPPSTAYKLKKFLRRNRAAVSAAAAILLVLVAGIAGTAYGLIRAENRRAEAEKARTEEAVQRQLAERAEAATLDDYRASTDDAIEHLIGSKSELGPQERAYLERTLERWKSFAARQGDDERSRAIRGEGHHRVASLWQRLGRPQEARAAYETARDLRSGLVAAFPDVPRYRRDLADTHDGLGVLLRNLGAHAPARAENEAALELRLELAEAFPDVPGYRHELSRSHSNLGVLLWDLGQRDDARKEFETVRDLLVRLVAASPDAPQYRDELGRTRHNLAVLLNREGRRDEAHAEFMAAIGLQQELAAAFPAVPAYRQELARTNHNTAVLLVELGQRDEARSTFETARDLRRDLAASFPAIPEYQLDLAHTHNSLGLLLNDLGQTDAACAEYATARDLQRKLVTAFPSIPEYQEDLAGTLNNEGLLLHGLGRHDVARAELTAAIEVHRKLSADYPAVPAYQADLGASYCNFANLVRDEGQLDDSLVWYGLGIRALAAVYDRDRRNVTAQQHLRNCYVGRARAYGRLRKHADAVQDFATTIELTPPAEQTSYRAERAVSRMRAGQWSEAVTEVEELVDASDWPADGWFEFACVYAVASKSVAGREAAYADRAVELLFRAIAAGYQAVARITADAELDALRGREDFQRLITGLEAGKK
jgi:serine/threonine protein kinase